MTAISKELYFAHSLDVAWIIALWHWIHGGDPIRNGQVADTSDLLARGLAGHLSGLKTEAPANAIEKLAKLGIKVTVRAEGKGTEVRTTKEFLELSARLVHGGLLPIYCITLADGVSEFCWAGRYIPPFLTVAKQD